VRRPLAAVPAIAIGAALLVAACSGGTGGGAPAGGTSTPVAGGTAAAASPAGGSGPTGPAPTTIAGYDAQKLNWRSCDSGFQCARLVVPFDYRRPAWRRFSLPVIKLPASNPARRVGSLVINPGGPGGSGVSYARQARNVVSAAVRARFDVVGFDPRGIGGSVPAVHCLTGPQLDKYFATSDNPASKAQLAAVVAQAKLFVRGCERRSGALLPYVGTRNAARDMDVLRAALGDAKLTYLGKSYGTYLGAWYAQLFPAHVRALVLDGAVNPDESGFSLNSVQAQGFEVALRSFTADCVRRPGCPLGNGTVGAGIARLQGLLRQTASKPLASQIAGQPANDAMLLNGVASALYSKSFWQYLRAGLTGAFAGNGTLLVELADALFERGPNGQYSNLMDVNTAVNCIDRPWPRSLQAYSSAAAAAAKAAPQFGASNMWSSLPCAYWPVHPAAPVPLRAADAPPILVVGTTRDPATPYRWAQALARDLKSGVLLGWNGDGHTAYLSGSTCVDSAVDRYLISLATPRNGMVCS
jgi:pimeloyl-ACP methyl ester carboxylesterase